MEMLNKEEVINSLKTRMSFFEQEQSKENDIKIKELKDLLYVINKGCFDITI